VPELPEVEHLKRTLEPTLIGATVLTVRVHRRDVVRQIRGKRRRSMKADLLHGQTITRLERHGKQLAVISDDGAICVHLGMSGQCRVRDPRVVEVTAANGRAMPPSHIHCRWLLHTSLGERELLFRDPRRFGGLWTYPSWQQLHTQRWAILGDDALTITGPQLRCAIEHSRRPIKAALLDQRLIAGVGNIYADESLFAARIHPQTLACALTREQVNTLARSIRTTLRRAIVGGGSTLRDYRDGSGQPGAFQLRHVVYGRAGLPCRHCATELIGELVAQRTTVHCPVCQSNGRTATGRR
jgi:formamidopyrimidine-DNA glycosylase